MDDCFSHFHWFSMWLTACCSFFFCLHTARCIGICFPRFANRNQQLQHGARSHADALDSWSVSRWSRLDQVGLFDRFQPEKLSEYVRIIKLGRMCLANFSHSSLQASWKFAMSRFMDDMAELWRPYCLTVEMVSPRQHDFCTCSGHGFC